MRVDTLLNSNFVKLQAGIRGVRKDSEDAGMRAVVQSARHVQDHGLCAVHASTTDDVQDLHEQQLPRRWYPALVD